MLDKRSARLMFALTRICTDCSYKIIDINDLRKAMLPRYRVDATALEPMIRLLSDNEMIDVKYSDEKVYCLTVLPKGRVYEEQVKVSKRGKKAGRYGWVFLAIVCFVAAFAGAFLAGLI